MLFLKQKKSRNISRLPIPQRDNRFIMWEVEGKEILPVQEYSNALLSLLIHCYQPKVKGWSNG